MSYSTGSVSPIGDWWEVAEAETECEIFNERQARMEKCREAPQRAINEIMKRNRENAEKESGSPLKE